MTGTVFDIKEFSLHDGPGARTTVFLKGCPLRCIWCHNPEGYEKDHELLIKKSLCTHCGNCEIECNHKECKIFNKCIYACPKGLICVSGIDYEANILAKKLLENADILTANHGGVTISGGEPLMQADFVIELLNYLDGVHKAIQTSGYADNETFKKVIAKLDYIMFDLKLADRDEHKKYTGVYNDKILQNLEYLQKSGKAFVIRVPLIPQITDTKENLELISKIADESRVELLPYNKLAGAKYKMLGKEFLIKESIPNNINTDIFKNATLLKAGG